MIKVSGDITCSIIAKNRNLCSEFCDQSSTIFIAVIH